MPDVRLCTAAVGDDRIDGLTRASVHLQLTVTSPPTTALLRPTSPS
jgi:hypothetical protein